MYHVQFVLLCMVKEIHKGMTKNIAKYSMRVFLKLRPILKISNRFLPVKR